MFSLSLSFIFHCVWEQHLPFSGLRAHFLLYRISFLKFTKSDFFSSSSMIHWSFLQAHSLFEFNSLGSHEDVKSLTSAQGSLTISLTCVSVSLNDVSFILFRPVRLAGELRKENRRREVLLSVSSVSIAPSAPGNWPIPSLFFWVVNRFTEREREKGEQRACCIGDWEGGGVVPRVQEPGLFSIHCCWALNPPARSPVS